MRSASIGACGDRPGRPEIGVASKVGVETIASTAPVRGSSATTAPGVAAELGRREVLEPPIDRQRQVARLRLAVQDVADEVADRVRIGPADQDVLEGALQAGACRSAGSSSR